jgi:hypothetical protein
VVRLNCIDNLTNRDFQLGEPRPPRPRAPHRACRSTSASLKFVLGRIVAELESIRLRPEASENP